MRMSSTSPTAEGSGSVVSGSDSAGFIYINNSQTELDIEFCGNTPGIINCTNWSTLNAHQTTSPSVANLAAGFHTYQLIWTPGQVQWTIDGVVVATHTSDVPSTPAYIMINFWGTNSANWGGLATPGVTRYMYVSSVSSVSYTHLDAILRVIPVDNDGQIMLDEYEKLLSSRTKLVSFTHVSNALGTITPAQQMVAMAHRYGARRCV